VAEWAVESAREDCQICKEVRSLSRQQLRGLLARVFFGSSCAAGIPSSTGSEAYDGLWAYFARAGDGAPVVEWESWEAGDAPGGDGQPCEVSVLAGPSGVDPNDRVLVLTSSTAGERAEISPQLGCFPELWAVRAAADEGLLAVRGALGVGAWAGSTSTQCVLLPARPQPGQLHRALSGAHSPAAALSPGDDLAHQVAQLLVAGRRAGVARLTLCVAGEGAVVARAVVAVTAHMTAGEVEEALEACPAGALLVPVLVGHCRVPVRLVVLGTHGSFNPVHHSHVMMMVEGRKAVEGTVVNGAQLCVVEGMVAITNPLRIKWKGAKLLRHQLRVSTIQEAFRGQDWVRVEVRGTEFGSGMQVLRWALPRLEKLIGPVVAFDVLGTDISAHARESGLPRVMVGRVGGDPVEGLAQVNAKREIPHLFLPCLPDMSSTKVREALEARDDATVRRLCPTGAANMLIAARNTGELWDEDQEGAKPAGQRPESKSAKRSAWSCLSQ